MLREVDLNKNLTKKEYKEMMDKLAPKFAALQREARAKGLPVMIVFEGWGASGKGTMISRLIQPLDPRGFKVFTIQAENEEEHMHPFLWRFWTKIPSQGRIAIFDRSWYRRVLVDRFDGVTTKAFTEAMRRSFRNRSAGAPRSGSDRKFTFRSSRSVLSPPRYGNNLPRVAAVLSDARRGRPSGAIGKTAREAVADCRAV